MFLALLHNLEASRHECLKDTIGSVLLTDLPQEHHIPSSIAAQRVLKRTSVVQVQEMVACSSCPCGFIHPADPSLRCVLHLIIIHCIGSTRDVHHEDEIVAGVVKARHVSSSLKAKLLEFCRQRLKREHPGEQSLLISV